MSYQTVFKRYELKYMITREQQARLIKAMEPYMTIDQYGRSTIRNIYFDTDDCILARHSIAKPEFKEKLRIRSYAQANAGSTVFVELKRKYDHVVYKRRVALPEEDAMNWISRADTGWRCAGSMSQMKSEIDYFLSYYGDLKPAAFLSYDRLAYRMKETARTSENNTAAINSGSSDFRVTFDENILFRDYDLSLTSEIYGTPLLEDDHVLMEIKCSGGIPMWMVNVLSEEHIYKTSFSKYGTAYTKYMLPSVAEVYDTSAGKVEELDPIEYKSRKISIPQSPRIRLDAEGHRSGVSVRSVLSGFLHYRAV